MSNATTPGHSWKYETNLNGTTVTGRRGGAIFVQLPRALWREIEGGCRCDFCEAVPGRKAYWDTLAVSQAKPARISSPDTTWMVHNPGVGSFRLNDDETEI